MHLGKVDFREEDVGITPRITIIRLRIDTLGIQTHINTITTISDPQDLQFQLPAVHLQQRNRLNLRQIHLFNVNNAMDQESRDFVQCEVVEGSNEVANRDSFTSWQIFTIQQRKRSLRRLR